MPTQPPTWYLGRRLSMTAKVVRAYAEQQLASAGANLTVAIATRILAATPDLAQRELADELGIEPPTMARHLDRMERDGIVVRTRDTSDRRVQRVRLTPRGHELCDRLMAVSASTHEALVAALSPRELAQLEASLDRIAAHAATLLDDRRSQTA